jgi:anti-sigma factor RsiW
MEELVGYLNGHLCADASLEVTHHLQWCVRCAGEYAGLSKVKRAAESLPDAELQPDLKDRILRKCRVETTMELI